MILKPLYDRVIVLPDTDRDRRSKGGLLLPDFTREHMRQGRTVMRRGLVVAAGPGRCHEDGDYRPMHVSPGDYVYYSLMMATEFQFHDDRGERRTMVLVDEVDILAIEEAGTEWDLPEKLEEPDQEIVASNITAGRA